MTKKTLDELLGGVKRFGRLTVVGDGGMAKGSRRLAVCQCDCGKVWPTRVDAIKRGLTVSCGCASADRAKTLAGDVLTRHGKARKGNISPEYNAHQNMKSRCYNENTSQYVRYGGRGISVCDDWLGPDGFDRFHKDMGDRPEGCSLDRIDVDGDYEPTNCRWASASTQARNQRRNRIVTLNGLKMTTADADDALGLNSGTVARRLWRGWSEYRALQPHKAI